MTLDQAAGNYRTALALLTEAEHQRAQAHAAHIDTIPLLGRVHVGNGSEPTRKAHHRARTAYLQATLRLHDAQLRSSLTRRDVDATARQVNDANTAALEARRAWEDARDALVVAALEEEG